MFFVAPFAGRRRTTRLPTISRHSRTATVPKRMESLSDICIQIHVLNSMRVFYSRMEGHGSARFSEVRNTDRRTVSRAVIRRSEIIH